VPQRKKGSQKVGQPHLLDTNILLRFLVGDDQPKAARATALMERVERREEFVEIPTEVLSETVWTLESFYKVPRRETTEKLVAVLRLAGVTSDTTPLHTAALDLYAETSADFVDCLLAARAQLENKVVYSFDKADFKKLPAMWNEP